jgi:hypothetical protein
MTEEEIRMRLDELSEVTSARDVARIDHEAARMALIPPEIQTALADLDAEFTMRDAAIALNIQELETEIKQAVLAHGASVKGAHVHAIYTPKANRACTGMRAGWIVMPRNILGFSSCALKAI